MMTPERRLDLLSTLYYVYGGLMCFSGFAMLGLVFVGSLFSSEWFTAQAQELPAAWIGGMVSTIGILLFIIIEVYGVLNLLNGKWIRTQTNRTASQVVAALDCFNLPFGIALGIFTFITLHREDVSALYAVSGRK